MHDNYTQKIKQIKESLNVHNVRGYGEIWHSLSQESNRPREYLLNCTKNTEPHEYRESLVVWKNIDHRHPYEKKSGSFQTESEKL